MKSDSFKQLFAFALLKNRSDPRKVTFDKQTLHDGLFKNEKKKKEQGSALVQRKRKCKCFKLTL